MIPVADARARILAGARPLPAEFVAISEAAGRVTAEPVVARVTQPPAAMSAMDGYAVRAADVAAVPATLRRIGESQAGQAFAAHGGAGECVRILTGAPVPAGADAIVIQEDADADGGRVVVREGAPAGRYVRPAGLDFAAGDVGVPAGRRLGPADIGLAAAMNVPWLAVRRRPRVALIATGDEIVRPGDPIGPAQIVSSNALALMALVREAGGEPVDLGIARDERESLAALTDAARGADLLVTLGGASVGERDLVREVLGARGLELDFWQIAMRPGKPLMHGRLGDTLMLGFPGNPVSSLVCGLLFLKPLVEAMLGLPAADPATVSARLGRDLAANDRREDYLRSTVARAEDGALVATPFERQDSSMLSRLARADALVVRPPHAPPAAAGSPVRMLPLKPLPG